MIESDRLIHGNSLGNDDDADTDTLIRRALQLKFTGKP